MIVRPTHGHLVSAAWSDRVPSPAYDAMTADERRRVIADHPDSYLNVTRSLEDLEEGDLTTADQLLATCRAQLDRLVAGGAFTSRSTATVYRYRLEVEGHTQISAVVELSVDAIRSGAIRPHEHVRTERAEVLARHLGVVGAQSSPIAVAARPVPGFDAALADEPNAEPVIDITSDDGLRQTVWALDDERAAAILAALDDVDLYLIDGHHRAAASVAHLETVEASAPCSPDNAAAWILSAVFPARSLRLLEFNRWVSELPVPADHFIERLRAVATVDAVPDAATARPSDRPDFAVYLDGTWYRCTRAIGAETLSGAELLRELPPVALQREVLAGLLGIDDPQTDERLEHTPGGRDLNTLAARVDRDGGVAFALPPLVIDDVLDLADEGFVLPPKSTYFHPKVRSGLFLRPLDPTVAP